MPWAEARQMANDINRDSVRRPLAIQAQYALTLGNGQAANKLGQWYNEWSTSYEIQLMSQITNDTKRVI